MLPVVIFFFYNHRFGNNNRLSPPHSSELLRTSHGTQSHSFTPPISAPIYHRPPCRTPPHPIYHTAPPYTPYHRPLYTIPPPPIYHTAPPHTVYYRPLFQPPPPPGKKRFLLQINKNNQQRKKNLKKTLCATAPGNKRGVPPLPYALKRINRIVLK